MNISFTGTRNGMTLRQRDTFRALITVLSPEAFIHGMADGADTDAEGIVRGASPQTYVIGYPAKGHKSRCTPDKVMHEMPPLERDRFIIQTGELLIATPRQAHEIRRSGTWATVRYMRQDNGPILIIHPNGLIHGEGARP